jgi:hypothetical protein
LLDLGGKIFIFPTLQLPWIAERTDEEFLCEFLQNVSKQGSVLLSSGYINLAKRVRKALLDG